MVDYDDVIARVTGPEGGARYLRIGLMLIVGGLLCIGLLYALAITQYGEENYSVGDLSGSDNDVLSIPNDEVMSYFNMALGGFLLVVLMGVVFLLEGRRVLNLRTFMPWHAEARATALYAMAAVFTLIGVVGAATLWSFGMTGQEMHFQGTIIHDEISMPSGAAVTVVGGLMLLGLLMMVYYQMVLSVYRGRYTPRTRMMARLAGGTALLGMAGLVVSRVGLVMIHELQIAVLDDSIIYFLNWNYPEVAYLATQDEFPSSWEDLAASLKGMYWLLWIGIVLALGGCIGTSAHSLGGDSQRVRFAVSLTFLAGLFLVGGALFGILAGGNANQAADAFGGYEVVTTVTSGIWAGIAGGFIGFLVGGAYVRYASPGLVLSGLGIAGARLQRPASGPGAEGRDIPDEAPLAQLPEPAAAKAGPPVGEEAPIDVEEVEPKVERLRRPIAIPGGMRGIVAILLVIIVIAASVWAIGRGGGGDGDGNGGGTDVNIEDLDSFSLSRDLDFSVSEGQTVRIEDAIDAVLSGQMSYEETVVFVNSVEVEVVWFDEAANNLVIDRWVNTPDTFSVQVYDDLGIRDESNEAANPQDGTGTVGITWDSDITWFVSGNESLVNTGSEDVDWTSAVTIEVTLESAGDVESIFGRTQADDRNDCIVHIRISGFVFVVE